MVSTREGRTVTQWFKAAAEEGRISQGVPKLLQSIAALFNSVRSPPGVEIHAVVSSLFLQAKSVA